MYNLYMTPIQEQLLSRLRQFATDHSLQLVSERPIDYGMQVIIAEEGREIPVNIYSTGRVVVGGKEGALRNVLKEWAISHQIGKTANPGRVQVAHIGVDEAGKGDIFGALVIAGALVLPEQSTVLQSMEIRDSKTLSSGRIRELADWLENRCPHEVLLLIPAEYNTLYAEMGNINKLLGWGHARVIQRLHARTGVSAALSDQFSERPHIQQALTEANCPVILEERPHAENDLAVAAASILARAAFERSFEELRHKTGLDLPYGASDPAISKFLQQIDQHWGEEGLRRSAKLNFKPVKAILNSSPYQGGVGGG